MKKFYLLLLLFICSCDSNFPIPDQCLRREIFAECMKSLPLSPTTTKYNDWNEVVEACENVAYYQSRRAPEMIKAECKLNN